MSIRTMTAAAAAVLLMAGAGLAGSAGAHPHPEGEGAEKRVEKIIIMSGDGKAGPGHVRRFRMEGPRGLAHCRGEKTEVQEEEKDGKRTRIVLCGKHPHSAEHKERLEKALSRIQANEHLSEEHRERIASRLREALERIKTTETR